MKKQVDAQRRRTYGISSADFDRMLEDQAGVCAICHKTNGSKALCIDHDHASGKVRGLLCAHCNHALGSARDNPAVLRAAAAYLEEYTP